MEKFSKKNPDMERRAVGVLAPKALWRKWESWRLRQGFTSKSDAFRAMMATMVMRDQS